MSRIKAFSPFKYRQGTDNLPYFSEYCVPRERAVDQVYLHAGIRKEREGFLVSRYDFLLKIAHFENLGIFSGCQALHADIDRNVYEKQMRGEGEIPVDRRRKVHSRVDRLIRER
jgi:hypothetical protein